MELIKKTLDVHEASGWFLIQNALRYWNEDIEDDETGEITTVERNEVLCGKGTCLNDITISLLAENGVKAVKVSNIPLLGTQEKNLNLWETVLKVRSNKRKSQKSYFVSADCPADAEVFISEYFEVNIEATFEVIKVNKLKYGKVIKMYETERDEYEADGKWHVKWYCCQIYAMFDENSETGNACTRNVLIQATSFEKAIEAIKLVNGRSEYESIYNTFKIVQELNIVDVFMPDEDVSFYSDNEISE
ncbi:MAG: DUF4494 family protein [Candidatus Symbiothrix sp.]|jgi:hypothetical protein|nr:DUF4494 family protein [Candidatus Symbiothrix sp.]